MCSGCHRFLETRKNGEYLDWKRLQLGVRKFNLLKRRYVKTKQWSERGTD
jgi:hypothetical protein